MVVISNSYWQTRLNGDPSIVGRKVDLNGSPFTIVGVAPSGFFGERMHDASPDFWIPLKFQPQIMRRESWLASKDVYWLNFVARLKPDVTRPQATASLNLQLRQFLSAEWGPRPSKADQKAIQRAFVQLDSGRSGISQVRQFYAEPLSILMGIVALVLLVACANVANLLLSRSEARRREFAVRRAIGASRGRLVRQLLTESLLLGILGGSVGLLLAYWSIHLLSVLVSRQLVVHVTTNPAVLAFTAATALATSLVFGIAPAWRLGEEAPAGAIRSVSERHHYRESWLARGLIAVQIGAALVLLSAAGLLTRTFVNLEYQALGFNPQKVLLVGIDTRLTALDPAELNALYRQLRDQVGGLPGVISASVAYFSPMGGHHNSTGVTVEGYAPHANEDLNVDYDIVGPGYFQTIGIAVRRGRAITAQDSATGAQVAVVNQAFVDTYFAGQDPIGRRIWIGRASYPEPSELPQEIVGIVANARYNDPGTPAGPFAYLPLSQSPEAYAGEIEVRTAGDPAAIAGQVREAIHSVDSGLSIASIRTLREQVDGQLREQHLVAVLGTLFSILALVLAAIGLYGGLVYWVSQRTGEIGVRLALGARGAGIARLVLARGMVVACSGIGAGLAVALASARLLASSLYGITPADPLSFAGATIVVVVVALFACLVPARRALRTDPASALRHE